MFKLIPTKIACSFVCMKRGLIWKLLTRAFSWHPPPVLPGFFSPSNPAHWSICVSSAARPDKEQRYSISLLLRSFGNRPPIIFHQNFPHLSIVPKVCSMKKQFFTVTKSFLIYILMDSRVERQGVSVACVNYINVSSLYCCQTNGQTDICLNI